MRKKLYLTRHQRARDIYEKANGELIPFVEMAKRLNAFKMGDHYEVCCYAQEWKIMRGAKKRGWLDKDNNLTLTGKEFLKQRGAL